MEATAKAAANTAAEAAEPGHADAADNEADALPHESVPIATFARMSYGDRQQLSAGGGPGKTLMGGRLL